MSWEYGFFNDGCTETDFVISKKYCDERGIDPIDLFITECTSCNHDASAFGDRDDIELTEGYIRYHPKTPEEYIHDHGEGGIWLECNKARGALPCYFINTEMGGGT